MNLFETLTLADIEIARLEDARRQRKWLERFAMLALYYHKVPRQRWELGAIAPDGVSWRCPKPTAERYAPGTNGWLEAAARKFRAGEWTAQDATDAYKAGKWLCL